jgi:hypothetical protein
VEFERSHVAGAHDGEVPVIEGGDVGVAEALG